jgi:hypothetical protein
MQNSEVRSQNLRTEIFLWLSDKYPAWKFFGNIMYPNFSTYCPHLSPWVLMLASPDFGGTQYLIVPSRVK